MRPIRHYENIHIPLWLVKDICWMLEWKTLGVTMVVPTMSVAIYLAFKTIKQDEFWVNLAICFWITANAYWMCCEFFDHAELKNYAGFPFVAGIISVSWFYYKRLSTGKKIINE